MGIPGLFSYLEKYNNDDDTCSTIKKQLHNNISEINLFLDFNGAIYQNIKPELKTYDSLIIYTLKYLDDLVRLYTEDKNKKLDLLFISLDGTPPRAKIEQQRHRRYHSTLFKYKQLELYKKYGKIKIHNVEVDEQCPINTDIDTTLISPGTDFMYKLGIDIKSHISESELYKDIEVHFSDWTIYGEGEHKILEFINQNYDKLNMLHIGNIIYGLDGDLIMLALSTHLNNIYLLREASIYGKYAFIHGDHKFLYLDIYELRNSIFQESQMNMLLSLDMLTENDKERIIDDYICLMMILGNDFMPKIKWFTISNNAHQELLEIYFQIFNSKDDIDKEKDQQFLYSREKDKINHRYLGDIFRLLSQKENDYAVTFFKKRKHAKPFIHKDLSKFKKNIKILEFLPLKFTQNELLAFGYKAINNYDNKYKCNDWRISYYLNCFNLDSETLVSEKKKIVETYIKTYLWNIRYYMQGHFSCDWDHYYYYDYAPTLLDIAVYMDSFDIRKTIKLSTSIPRPLTPLELLTIILPYSNSKHMPTKLFNLLNTNYKSLFFPTDYSLNIMLHTRYYECTPVIPRINIDFIRSLFKQTTLSEKEKKLNIINNVFIKPKLS